MSLADESLFGDRLDHSDGAERNPEGYASLLFMWRCTALDRSANGHWQLGSDVSMLQCTSWQKLHARAFHQLLVADRPPHHLPLAVLLPMRPSPLGRGVIDQLVEI